MRQSRRRQPHRNPRPGRTGDGRTQREQQSGAGQQVGQQRMPCKAAAAARLHVPEYDELEDDQHEDPVDDAAGDKGLLHQIRPPLEPGASTRSERGVQPHDGAVEQRRK